MGLDHIPHLYDNKEIKYEDVVNILTKAAKGQLKGIEEVDGLTVYLGYKDGQPKAARNEEEIKIGGFSAEDFSQREFEQQEHIRDIFNAAFDTFSRVVERLNNEQINLLFGKDGNTFLNCEILSGKTNIVTYDTKIIVIHRTGHKEYVPETDEVKQIKPEKQKAISLMINNFNEILQIALQGTQFKVHQDPVVSLPGVEDQSILANTIQRFKQSGFNEGMSINDYLLNKVKIVVKEKFPILNDEYVTEIAKKIVGIKSSDSIKVLKSYIKNNPKFTEDLKQLIFNKDSIIDNIMFEIEDIIHDFSVEVLNKLNSSYLTNKDIEIQALKDQLNQKIKQLEDYNGSDKQDIINNFKKQISKLKHIDKIQNTINGFIFYYNDKPYKLTGNLEPINKILNINKNSLQENKEKHLTLKEIFVILDEINSVGGGAVEGSSMPPIKRKKLKNIIKSNSINEIFNLIDIYLKESKQND